MPALGTAHSRAMLAASRFRPTGDTALIERWDVWWLQSCCRCWW